MESNLFVEGYSYTLLINFLSTRNLRSAGDESFEEEGKRKKRDGGRGGGGGFRSNCILSTINCIPSSRYYYRIKNETTIQQYHILPALNKLE